MSAIAHVREAAVAGDEVKGAGGVGRWVNRRGVQVVEPEPQHLPYFFGELQRGMRQMRREIDVLRVEKARLSARLDRLEGRTNSAVVVQTLGPRPAPVFCACGCLLTWHGEDCPNCEAHQISTQREVA